MISEMKKCNSPFCSRKTIPIAAHCCHPCAEAHIRELPPPAEHAEACDSRHAKRGEMVSK